MVVNNCNEHVYGTTYVVDDNCGADLQPCHTYVVEVTSVYQGVGECGTSTSSETDDAGKSVLVTSCLNLSFITDITKYGSNRKYITS